MRRAFRLSALFVATLAFATGCKVSTTGQSNTLNFAYEDPDSLLTRDLDAPIAVGTQVRLEVRTANRETKVRIGSATVDGAARVVSFDGNTVVVEGVSAGQATLTIGSDQGDDAVILEIAETDEVSLALLNQAERVLAGGTEPLGVQRRAAGQLLVGEAPVTNATARGAEVVDGPAHRITVRYGTEGTAEIAIDDSTLTRTIVGLDVVAELETKILAESGAVGETQLGYFQAKDMAGEHIAALGGLVEATVADESVCSYESGDFLGIEGARIKLLSVGNCVIDLALGTHTAQWTIEVKPVAEAEVEE